MRNDKILNQKGLALITVFFIFLVALIVVGAIVVISITEIGTTKTNLDAEQAFNLAEAGINWAKAKLATNYTYSTTGSFINTPNIGTSGTALVKVENPGGTASSTWTATITAKGFVSGTASRAIQNVMQISLSLPQITFDASAYWHRAMWSDGPISGTGSRRFLVDSAGDTPVGPTIQSNYSVSGVRSIDFDNYVQGSPGLGYVPPANPPANNPTKYTYAPVTADPIPTMDFNYWRTLAKQSGTYVNGDITIASGTVNGIYFAEGMIDLSGRLIGNASFISMHEILMTGSGQLGDGKVGLIAAGLIDIGGSGDISGLVYSSTSVNATGSGQFYGSIVSKGFIHFTGSGDLHYRSGSGQGGVIPGMGSGTTTATSVTRTSLSWQEVAP